MRIHFFTAPFLLCFHLVQGSRFRVQGSGFGVQGSGFRVVVAASPQLYVGRCPIKNHSRPFLWKGQTSEVRRGWHPRV